jgi:hypothetical protein
MYKKQIKTKMPDYNKAKIYTIRCLTDDSLIYVGSTIQPLAVRLGTHKSDSKSEAKKHYLIYRIINNEWDNWHIELYENYPCENKEQLCKREGEIIRQIATLNSQIAGRNQQQWVKENKEKILMQKKSKYNENKEEELKKAKAYYEKNKERISAYYKEQYLKKKEQYKANYIRKKLEKLKE